MYSRIDHDSATGRVLARSRSTPSSTARKSPPATRKTPTACSSVYPSQRNPHSSQFSIGARSVTVTTLFKPLRAGRRRLRSARAPEAASRGAGIERGLKHRPSVHAVGRDDQQTREAQPEQLVVETRAVDVYVREQAAVFVTGLGVGLERDP